MNTYTIQNINIGVDTGKTQLDIYLRPIDIFFSVPNDNKGIKQAIKTIKKHNFAKYARHWEYCRGLPYQ